MFGDVFVSAAMFAHTMAQHNYRTDVVAGLPAPPIDAQAVVARQDPVSMCDCHAPLAITPQSLYRCGGVPASLSRDWGGCHVVGTGQYATMLDGVTDMKRYGLYELLDIVVVGAGPAALVVLHAAKEAGLSAVAIDKGQICSALCSHPTYMRWFSTTDKLELCGFPLLTQDKNPSRAEYLKYCRAFVKYFDLKVIPYQEVTAIEQEESTFYVRTKDMFDRRNFWRASNVVVATGFYDSPRALGVPGEDLPKVSHRYSEPHPYFDQEVLVVGAGSSAAEVALELWRNGAHVTVAMRGSRFSTKYWIEPDIENRIKEGSIHCFRNCSVVEIRPDDVVIVDESGNHTTILNDFVLAMTGYEPDTSLIERVGAKVDHECGKPSLSGNMESTVPGLYVAGTLCAGQESNIVFVENSREHGPTIIEHILSKRTETVKLPDPK